MDFIEVNNRKFTPYILHDDIQKEVSRIAAEIDRDYKGKRPLFISILNGSFMFASDLFKHLTIEAEISFIKLASYKGTRSTGQVITSIGLDESLKGRHVVILEDIVDTGKTLHSFLPSLSDQNPASLRVASLLHKPEALEHEITIDYLGFSVPNKFLLGYGLDFDGLARNLKDIYQLVDESK
jgi:hypoxanthine phosphoribosyltransferase